jgi:predicted nucleic acid-binding protein
MSREVGEEKADQVIAFTETCNVVDFDTAIALSSAELCAGYKLATADAVIYATSLANGAELLTCDRHFQGLSSVRFGPKPEGQ